MNQDVVVPPAHGARNVHRPTVASRSKQICESLEDLRCLLACASIKDKTVIDTYVVRVAQGGNCSLGRQRRVLSKWKMDPRLATTLCQSRPVSAVAIPSSSDKNRDVVVGTHLRTGNKLRLVNNHQEAVGMATKHEEGCRAEYTTSIYS
jgi:hypothetical protein